MNLPVEDLISDIDKLFTKHLTFTLEELKKQAKFTKNKNLIEVLECIEMFTYQSTKSDGEINFAEWLNKSVKTITEGQSLIEGDSYFKDISECVKNALDEAITSEVYF